MHDESFFFRTFYPHLKLSKLFKKKIAKPENPRQYFPALLLSIYIQIKKLSTPDLSLKFFWSAMSVADANARPHDGTLWKSRLVHRMQQHNHSDCTLPVSLPWFRFWTNLHSAHHHTVFIASVLIEPAAAHTHCGVHSQLYSPSSSHTTTMWLFVQL